MFRGLKHDQKQQQFKPTSQQVIIAAVFITAVVTLYSLNELHNLLARHSDHGMPGPQLPGQLALSTATASSLTTVAAASSLQSGTGKLNYWTAGKYFCLTIYIKSLQFPRDTAVTVFPAGLGVLT
jgi:hypothetical protein